MLTNIAGNAIRGTKIRYKWMNRTEMLKQKTPGMYVVDKACSHVSWPSSHEHTSTQQQAAAPSSTRATSDSSFTRTPVIAVVVLLRTARAALERRA